MLSADSRNKRDLFRIEGSGWTAATAGSRRQVHLPDERDAEMEVAHRCILTECPRGHPMVFGRSRFEEALGRPPINTASAAGIADTRRHRPQAA